MWSYYSQDLEQFISATNEKLKRSNLILCANSSNAYDANIVQVKRGLNFNQDTAAAHASFRTAKSIEDCHFPMMAETKIEWMYFGPILAIGALSIFNFLCIIFCKRTRGDFVC